MTLALVVPHVAEQEQYQLDRGLPDVLDLIDQIETWLLLVPDVQSCGWRSECSAEIRVLKKSMRSCLQHLKEVECYKKQNYEEPCRELCMPCRLDGSGQNTCEEYVMQLEQIANCYIKKGHQLYETLKRRDDG
jgi:hypothetical protein